MTYREKLEKYKKKLLSEDEMKEVAEEIEKADAISEYLAEQLEEELNLKDHVLDETVLPAEEAEFGEKEKSFEMYVKKSIRRAYLKMGLGIGAVLLVVLLFLQYGLSPLLNSMYYNPAKQIEIPSEDGNSAVIFNEMNMDFGIYAELTMPCKNEAYVMAFPQGFGNYALSIRPSVSYGIGDTPGTGGFIRRGKLELYDQDYLDPVIPNYFVCCGLDPEAEKDYKEQLREMSAESFVDEDGLEYHTQIWFYDSLETAEAAVEGLEEDRRYLAYVSFRRDLNFTETNALMEELLENVPDGIMQPWLAVRNDETNTFPYGVTGYNYENCITDSVPSEYNEKYPYLAFGDENGVYDYEEMRRNEEIMTQHIISMCEYLGDKDAFVEMMDAREHMSTRGRFRSYSAYIKEHGLNSYGFVCVATKADMQKMLENENIIGIVPRDWN